MAAAAWAPTTVAQHATAFALGQFSGRGVGKPLSQHLAEHGKPGKAPSHITLYCIAQACGFKIYLVTMGVGWSSHGQAIDESDVVFAVTGLRVYVPLQTAVRGAKPFFNQVVDPGSTPFQPIELGDDQGTEGDVTFDELEERVSGLQEELEGYRDRLMSSNDEIAKLKETAVSRLSDIKGLKGQVRELESENTKLVRVCEDLKAVNAGVAQQQIDAVKVGEEAAVILDRERESWRQAKSKAVEEALSTQRDVHRKQLEEVGAAARVDIERAKAVAQQVVDKVQKRADQTELKFEASQTEVGVLQSRIHLLKGELEDQAQIQRTRSHSVTDTQLSGTERGALEAKVAGLERDNRSLRQDLLDTSISVDDEKSTALQELGSEVLGLEKQVSKLTEELGEKQVAVDQLDKQTRQLEEEIARKKIEEQERSAKILQKINEDMAAHNRRLTAWQNRNKAAQVATVSGLQGELDRAKEDVKRLEREVVDKNQTIHELVAESNRQDRQQVAVEERFRLKIMNATQKLWVATGIDPPMFNAWISQGVYPPPVAAGDEQARSEDGQAPRVATPEGGDNLGAPVSPASDHQTPPPSQDERDSEATEEYAAPSPAKKAKVASAPSSQASSPGRSLKCKACDRTFTSRKLLDRHCKEAHKEPLFVCYTCPIPKWFHTSQMLITHKKRHSPPQYQCVRCGKKFHTKSELLAHSRVHDRGSQVRCSHRGCRRRYPSWTGLARHVRSTHRAVPSQCTQCNHISSNVVAIKQHWYDHHKEMGPPQYTPVNQ